MSFHELVGDYPWLVKRMAAVRALAAGEEVSHPSRNKLAGLLALFVPRMGGGGAGAVVVVAIIGVMAAMAIPAYEGYVHKAQVASAYQVGKAATAKIGGYYVANEAIPTSLAQAGVQIAPSEAIAGVQFDPDSASLHVETRIASLQGNGALVFTPSLDEQKNVIWRCAPENLAPDVVPSACR
jgi:type II secretory pathway pseudopilin PulG